MVRALIAAAVGAVLLTPSTTAEPSDTLVALVTRDAVITTQGFSITLNYHEDGTFTGQAMETQFSGQWRIEDTRLCTRSSLSPTETCTEYPVGKRPGDEFAIVNPALGQVMVRINN